LVDKLFKVVNGKTSQGVYNIYGEEVIQKELNLLLKNIGDIDFSIVSYNNWTTDKEKNELIVQYF
jgi:DNA-directed RNA polymerase subunit beta